jgi:predicted glycoside hydrolase/deacetylase ChbG (UPF0249 family)
MRFCMPIAFAILFFQVPAQAQISGVDLLRKMGFPLDSKLLILHADDVAMSHSANVASFEALEKRWVSSASIMVPCPWFDEVVEFARKHPDADLGLHLTLTSEWNNYRWGPVNRTHYESLLDGEGYFYKEREGVRQHASAADAAAEVDAQVEKARAGGIHFTHLDNHMGAWSQNATLFGIYAAAAEKQRAPFFFSGGEVKAYPEIFKGREALPLLTYIGPGDSKDLLEGFRKTFASLKPGVYIIIVHLGLDDAELRAIMQDRDDGAKSRQREFDLVRSDAFRKLLRDNGIRLIRWSDVAKALPKTD